MSAISSFQGRNFSAINLGPLETLDSYRFEHPALASPVEGKVFLRQNLQLTSAEISINKLAAGCSMPFAHNHDRHEEVYIFIAGKGEFLIDDQSVEVTEGTVLRIDPAGIRCWRNLSQDPLYYIVVQAVAGSFQVDSPVSDGHGFPLPESWRKGACQN